QPRFSFAMRVTSAVLPPSNVVKPHEAHHSPWRTMLPGRRTRAESRTMSEKLSPSRRSSAALAAFRPILPASLESACPAEFQCRMRSDKVVIAPEQSQMLFQTLLPTGVTYRFSAKIRGALPDCQIQPFDKRRIQC